MQESKEHVCQAAASEWEPAFEPVCWALGSFNYTQLP